MLFTIQSRNQFHVNKKLRKHLGIDWMQLVFIHDFYFETVAVIFQKGRIADFEKAFDWVTRDVEKRALRKLGLKSGWLRL